jgi:uncharacterized integral membrane protein
MRLLDRLRIQREAVAAYKAAMEQGKSPEECCDIVADAMIEKYGAIDIAKLIELLLMIFAMFNK